MSDLHFVKPLPPIEELADLNLNWIKPALGRICLQAIPEEQRTKAGIYIVNNKEQSGQICRVVEVCDPYSAAPDDEDNDAPEGPMYKIGQLVLIGKYNGVDVQLGREKYIILRESDVIGTVHSKES